MLATQRMQRQRAGVQDAVVEFAVRQAENLIRKSGVSTPPFLPQRMAHLQGVKRVLKEDLGSLSGLLLPLEDGYEIKVNATHSPERQNFSVAHEIAHTFFYEGRGKELVERHEKAKGEQSARHLEENLCDLIASELLMPSQVFRMYAASYDFRIYSIVPLSGIFGTSLVPTALRLCDVNPRSCSLVHWSLKNQGGLTRPELRPTWWTWSNMNAVVGTGRFRFNPRVSCDTSNVAKAYLSGNHVFSHERLRVGNFTGYGQIWSQSFSSGEARFVLSLILPDLEGGEE